MSEFTRSGVPFSFTGKTDFPVKLAAWMGRVFYDILPQWGYEIREEQIFTAFQLADAVCRGKVHFAEAGLGTGKTFAYLLTAIPYARFTGKPVVIACASTALQEQLAGLGGDIDTLSRLLNLDVDVRLAKDQRQYICDAKIRRLVNRPGGQEPEGDIGEILRWAEEKTHRGERSQMPLVPDRVWKQVAWDESMACETCSSRGFCKLVRAREYYRPARDLIVGNHGIFFDDLWTRESRILDGIPPLLPDYAAVVFDEGHKIMLPAAMKAGRQIVKEDIYTMLSHLEQVQGARTALVSATFALRSITSTFFKVLYRAVMNDEQSRRLALRVDEKLLKTAFTFRRALNALYFELQNEQELHIQSLSATLIQAWEVRIERAMVALDSFCRNKGADSVNWVDRSDGSFWVVPRDLRGLLRRNLFARGLPVVFSSATLSAGGDFSYLARTLGVEEPSVSSVESSFDFQRQVQVYLPRRFPEVRQESWFATALRRLVSLLRLSRGRALVLTRSRADVRKIRRGLGEYSLPFTMLWEDSAERGYLVQRFREDLSSVLVGSGFWEGIDVPGEALSLLVIWKLPFPARDPLIEARRREAGERNVDPLTGVDYPEMSLKLKQGCGRLIRKQSDRGVIAILEPVTGMPWERLVMEALPVGAGVLRGMKGLTFLRPGPPI